MTWDDDEKEAMSPSRFNTFDNCQVAYEYSYKKNIKIPPRAAMIAGSAAHKGVELDMRRKVASGELASLEEVQDEARDQAVARWEGKYGVRIQGTDKEVPVKVLKARTIDDAVSFTTLHHQQVAPHTEPTHVERKWRLRLPQSPFDLRGIIDLQEARGIRDWKTSRKSPPKNGADISRQATIYSMAFRAIEGFIPYFRKDTLVLLKTKVKVDTQIATRTETQLDTMALRLDAQMAVIQQAEKAGLYAPASPEHWMCTEQWCGYWDRCPFAMRPMSVTVPEAVKAAS